MSYNDNIGMFLGSLGNFYDNVPVEDIEMLLGPVIDRVRASPGSPLQNSPLGSRETSPTRVPRHLVNKTNISSLETSPISSMSPSPQPPDTDDENEEFIDTVETTPNAIRKVYKNDATNGRNSDMFECNGSKEKCERNGKTPKMNGHVISNPRTINSTSVQNGKGGHTNGLSLDEDSEGPARTKSRERESPNVTKRRMVKQNGEIQTDLSEPLREAVLHLQKDLDRITARVRSLEVCMLSQPLAFQEVELCNSCDANLTTQIDEFEDCIQIPVKSLVEGEPTKDLNKSKLFPELSRKTLLFVVVWPFLAHFLMRFLQTKRIKNCKPFTRSMLFSFSVRARYILAPSAS
ncbi:hypothetical protein RUM43_011760 [Polyplax serrata]|uniref:Uncharacterized protein n=1 Tax=Polyplax serrata TaxID=468196 RepID=A0AAN8Q3B5_POLSC